MSVAAKPAFRIDDYTGAFVGFAGGSAMLWTGSTGLWGPLPVPAWLFESITALAAACALAFAGCDMFNASPHRRLILRLASSATLALAALLILPSRPGFGSLLMAFAAGSAALAWSRLGLRRALGLWCIAVAVATSLEASHFPLFAAELGYFPAGKLLIGGLGLATAVSRNRLLYYVTLATVVAILLLTGAPIAHGLFVVPFVFWPALGGVALAAAAERPLVWSQNLRGVLSRRVAFVAFAALWAWASSAAIAISHEAAAGALRANEETIDRALLQFDVIARSMQALPHIDERGDPRHVYEAFQSGAIPLQVIARYAPAEVFSTAWPPITAPVSGATRAAIIETERRALRMHALAVSSFMHSGDGVAVAAAAPLPRPDLGVIVAVYPIDQILARIAKLNAMPAVTLRISDGDSSTPDVVIPSAHTEAAYPDLVTTRSLTISGAQRTWTISASYAGAPLTKPIKRQIAFILLALLVATGAIVWMSAKFAERIAAPIREIRERAAKIANGTPFDPLTTDNVELGELVNTLVVVSNAIRSRDQALTLAHDLTLGTFGLRETTMVREMAEHAVESYFGVAGCAQITNIRPGATAEGASLESPRDQAEGALIRYPLRAAGSTLEVRLPEKISDDDLTSLSLLADTADLAIGASALLRTLGEERTLLDHIYASVPVGIVLVDPAGCIVLANEAALRLFRESTTPIVGMRLADLLGTGELHEGRILVGERQRPVDVVVRPAIDGSRSLVVLRDLTEQEAIEGLKSEFIAAVSHDLRTPLTAIKGFAVLLQERTDLDTEVCDILKLVDRAANRLTRMIDDLMQSALLESGRLALMVEPIPLGSAVRGLSLLEAESPSHQLVVEVPISLGVLADRDRLEQVLVNLVSNAYKYAPGGRVLVRARAVRNRVEIAVSDDGPGIAPEEQGRIFEKFYQAHSKGKKRRGVGLGLYISRELIERMGGTLTVRSVPGFGATFAISLRAAELGTRAERTA